MLRTASVRCPAPRFGGLTRRSCVERGCGWPSLREGAALDHFPAVLHYRPLLFLGEEAAPCGPSASNHRTGDWPAGAAASETTRLAIKPDLNRRVTVWRSLGHYRPGVEPAVATVALDEHSLRVLVTTVGLEKQTSRVVKPTGVGVTDR